MFSALRAGGTSWHRGKVFGRGKGLLRSRARYVIGYPTARQTGRGVISSASGYCPGPRMIYSTIRFAVRRRRGCRTRSAGLWRHHLEHPFRLARAPPRSNETIFPSASRVAAGSRQPRPRSGGRSTTRQRASSGGRSRLVTGTRRSRASPSRRRSCLVGAAADRARPRRRVDADRRRDRGAKQRVGGPRRKQSVRCRRRPPGRRWAIKG